MNDAALLDMASVSGDSEEHPSPPQKPFTVITGETSRRCVTPNCPGHRIRTYIRKGPFTFDECSHLPKQTPRLSGRWTVFRRLMPDYRKGRWYQCSATGWCPTCNWEGDIVELTYVRQYNRIREMGFCVTDHALFILADIYLTRFYYTCVEFLARYRSR